MYKVVCVNKGGHRTSCILKEVAKNFMLKYSTKTKTTAIPGTKLLAFDDLGDAIRFTKQSGNLWSGQKIEVWKIRYWGKKTHEIFLSPCDAGAEKMLLGWKDGVVPNVPSGTVGIKTVKLSKLVYAFSFLFEKEGMF